MEVAVAGHKGVAAWDGELHREEYVIMECFRKRTRIMIQGLLNLFDGVSPSSRRWRARPGICKVPGVKGHAQELRTCGSSRCVYATWRFLCCQFRASTRGPRGTAPRR